MRIYTVILVIIKYQKFNQCATYLKFNQCATYLRHVVTWGYFLNKVLHYSGKAANYLLHFFSFSKASAQIEAVIRKCSIKSCSEMISKVPRTKPWQRSFWVKLQSWPPSLVNFSKSCDCFFFYLDLKYII